MFPELYAMVGSKVPDLRGRMLIGSSDTNITKQMVGTNALSFTLNNTQLPNHNHQILYNVGTSNDGGIWGGRGEDAGNYGDISGLSGFASTANFGGGQPVNLTVPTPPSYTINYYICCK